MSAGVRLSLPTTRIAACFCLALASKRPPVEAASCSSSQPRGVVTSQDQVAVLQARDIHMDAKVGNAVAINIPFERMSGRSAIDRRRR